MQVRRTAVADQATQVTTSNDDEVERLKAELRKVSPNYDRNERWREAYESGDTLREIATRENVDTSTVFRQLRKMGVDTSSRKPRRPQRQPKGLLGWVTGEGNGNDSN